MFTTYLRKCSIAISLLLCTAPAFGACVDEGNGDAWGVDPATNEGCWIGGIRDPNYCRDDNNGDEYGKTPDTGEICSLTAETAAARAAPSITNFEDGATIQPTQLISFADNGTSVNDWVLRVGSAQAKNNYFDSGILNPDVTEQTVTGLPEGALVHISLYYRDTSGDWIPAFYTANVAADNEGPEITNFSSGDTIKSDQIVRFSSNGTFVKDWILRVGSSQAGNNYYDSDFLAATVTQHTLLGLPPGEFVHITLYYRNSSGKWVPVFYTANVQPDDETPTDTLPAITNFSDGATIESTQVAEFSSNDTLSKGWVLRAGPTPESRDYYDSGVLPASATRHTVSGLPKGKSVHLTLFYKDQGGRWVPRDYRVSVAKDGNPGSFQLTDSGPYVVQSDGEVVEKLNIDSPRHDRCAVLVSGKKNVVVRNLNISHAGAGICVINSQGVKIQTVKLKSKIGQAGPHCKPNVSVYDCKRASRKRDGKYYSAGTDKLYDENTHHNIYVKNSASISIDTAYLEKGESGILTRNTTGVDVNNIHCVDIRGPYPRGQCVMFARSDGARLTNFYVQQFLETSSGHDNISAFMSTDVEVFNGLVVGNYSRNGVGVIADNSSHNMSVRDVDLVRQGTGVNAWSGKYTKGEPDGPKYAGVPDNFRVERVRARDGRCEGTWYGPDIHPSSQGVAFALHPFSRNAKFINSQYWNHCRSYAVFPREATIKDIVKAPFTPKDPPVVMDFPWED